MNPITQYSFSSVPTADIQRSSFDRSHSVKTTFDQGLIIPVYVDEALPGDTFNMNMKAFCRMATPIKPLMDNLFLDSFFFAVPNRLIWNNFQAFMGERTDPDTDVTGYLVPRMQAPSTPGVTSGSLADYMGLPVGMADYYFNSLHFRAYNLIYNEWFRDQNLIDAAVVDKDDGPDTYTDYVLRRRGKRHDYFTSCLPWAQKADDPITLPLGSTAPVEPDGNAFALSSQNGTTWARALRSTSGSTTVTYSSDPGSTGDAFYYQGLQVDLSGATAATINSLREAFQLQKLLERDARGGTRYIEIVKSHFQVESPDLRATRPIYLGGGSSPINMHPVTQTGPTVTNQTPQGNLAAFATAAINGHGFTHSFTEHCVILGLVSVRSEQTYQQGLHKMWSRRTKYDFYWPALAHLGEMPVLNKELYLQGTSDDDLTFGFQERWADYRYKPSLVTGKFKSGVAGDLDVWHLAQEFDSLPTLGQTFIEENAPMSRVIAVSNEVHFLFDAYFDLKCARPMPMFSVPGLMDHF